MAKVCYVLSNEDEVEFDDDLYCDVFLDSDQVLPYHTIIEVEGIAVHGTSGSPLFDELCLVRVVIFDGLDDIESDVDGLCAQVVPIRCLMGLMHWESKRKSGDSIYLHGDYQEEC